MTESLNPVVQACDWKRPELGANEGDEARAGIGRPGEVDPLGMLMPPSLLMRIRLECRAG
jgi:hypothetical protein